MPTGPIDYQKRMGARFDMAADLQEVRLHGCSVHLWKNQPNTQVTRRANGTEYPGGFETAIANHPWTCPGFSPTVGQRAFLTDSGLILKPYLDRSGFWVSIEYYGLPRESPS